MTKFFTKPYASVLDMVLWGFTLQITDKWWPPLIVLLISVAIRGLVYQRVTRQTFEEFCRDWLRWAEDGGNSHPRFRPDRGLCYSAPPYLRNELTKRLIRDHGSAMAPFGSYSNLTHLNPERLAWVRSQISC